MQEETPSCKPQGYSPVISLPTRDGAPNTDEAKELVRTHAASLIAARDPVIETIRFTNSGAEPNENAAAAPQQSPARDPPAETPLSQPAPPPAAPEEATSSARQKRGREPDAEQASKRRAAAKQPPKALVPAPPVEALPAATPRRPIPGPAAPTKEVVMEESTACADGVGVDATPAAQGQPEEGAAVVTPEATSAPETTPATESTAETAPATAPAFSLAVHAPESPADAELASHFPAEGDTVEIIFYKGATLEEDGAGDRCIVASLRGPFPDKKKKKTESSLPAYHVYAELRSLVRLAGGQEHAFELVDETDRREKHVHPEYKLSLHSRGTVWRRV